jgi:hypothetical protein
MAGNRDPYFITHASLHVISRHILYRGPGTARNLIGANFVIFRNLVDVGNRVVIQDWDADLITDYG